MNTASLIETHAFPPCLPARKEYGGLGRCKREHQRDHTVSSLRVSAILGRSRLCASTAEYLAGRKAFRKRFWKLRAWAVCEFEIEASSEATVAA